MISQKEEIDQDKLHKQLPFLKLQRLKKKCFSGERLLLIFGKRYLEVTRFTVSGKHKTDWHDLPKTIGEIMKLIP